MWLIDTVIKINILTIIQTATKHYLFSSLTYVKRAVDKDHHGLDLTQRKAKT